MLRSASSSRIRRMPDVEGVPAKTRGAAALPRNSVQTAAATDQSIVPHLADMFRTTAGVPRAAVRTLNRARLPVR